MLEAGYTDLRPPTAAPTPSMAWQERLRLASLAYQAFDPEDAEEIARSLDFLEGENESAENICGPLAAAILRDAGLLPNLPGPIQDLKSFWQARPITNGRPWNMFPERDYEVFHYDTPLAEFDFIAWPLQPGDFLYTYAEHSGFEHMFIVTEVDAEHVDRDAHLGPRLPELRRTPAHILRADPVEGTLDRRIGGDDDRILNGVGGARMIAGAQADGGDYAGVLRVREFRQCRGEVCHLRASISTLSWHY